MIKLIIAVLLLQCMPTQASYNSYDPNDNRSNHTDPNDQTTTLDYDNRNRLISVSYPDSNTETMAYDGMGNLITSIDANGRTTTHDYDQRNRRTRTIYSGATGAAIAAIDFAYDNNSNLTQVDLVTASGEQRTTLRQYDAFDRLERSTDRFGNSMQYDYDANGNRRRLIDQQNRITQYQYDELNRLESINAPRAGQVVYSYYNNSQLRQIEWPNGTQSHYQYDAAERIERIEHQLAGASFAEAQYDYDVNGNRSQQIISQGTQTEQTSYGYDAADRLTQILEPNRNIDYTLDGNANRLTETVTDNNQTTINDKTYAYNSRDQLQSVQDAISSNLTQYQYDANGNQTQKTDSTGLTNMSYGPRDRLLTITLPGAPPLAYSYNDQGLRDSQSQNGTQLNYLYDQQSLIAESNSLGDEIARYTHSSVGLIAEARNGIQTYIHGDALNTPIAITDTTGAVTSRYTWDTWGNLQQQTGISQQPFGFTGYQRDSQTGLHYAQQRYYDSEIGRFNRHDPFRGDINIPLSLHRYLYANANPTIFVDPDGRKTSFDIRFTAREKALLSGELSEQEFFEQNAAEAKGAIAGASVLAGGVGVGLGVRAGIAALSTAIAEIRSVGLLNAIGRNLVTINTVGTEATIAAAAVTTGAEIPLNAPVTAARQLTTKLAQSAQKARETVKSGAFLVTESRSGVSNVLKRSVAETGRIDLSADLGLQSAFDRSIIRQRVLGNLAESQNARPTPRFQRFLQNESSIIERERVLEEAFQIARFGDVSSNGRGIVLFSGKDRFKNQNSDLARKFAEINKLSILNTTNAGRELDRLDIFRRFALTNEQRIIPDIAHRTDDIFRIVSERFVRQSPEGVPIYAFVDGANPERIFNTVELPTALEIDRQVIRVRANSIIEIE